ncbi:MAG: hypothetical protein QOF58_6166, partial [Pseudonocardiales bacterium]|nr:hypothetical protein [Pseudonocardiales bacterium]
ILSAVRRSVPGLPEVDPVELGKLRTLDEITARLGSAKLPARAGTERAGTEQASAERAGAEQADTEQVGGLVRYAVRMTPSAAPGFALKGLRDGRIVVTDDGRGIATHVVKRLVAAGADAVVGVAEGAYGVIHLGGLKDVTSVDEAVAVQRDVFATARTVADKCGVFVTVQDTGGDFGVSAQERAWLGGVAGLTRTARREWAGAGVKAIDIERGRRTSAAVAQAIVNELLAGGSTTDVGLRADGTRLVVEAVVTGQPEARHEITGNDVIVATGGARGVTAEALKELARQHKPKLVLLGRTPRHEEPAHLKEITDEAALKRAVVDHVTKTTGKPPLPAKVNAEVSATLAAREVAKTVADIRQAGSQVRYVAVDARDHVALRRELDTVRQEWGPITGIVHGAGVIADKRIAEKTDDQFDRVFDTKVEGLRGLLAATENDPIRTLCVFSSISAHVGNPGQCDYAMANEVLNQVAHAQARPGRLVRSIAWGPWEGGMVSPSLADHFHSQGVPLIPIAEGARQFVAELTGAGEDVHVVISAGEAGPIDGAEDTTERGEILLSARTHAYLADHDIEGTPVVPIALALEWFSAHSDVVTDVKVLRRIGLDNFTGTGDRITVERTGDALSIGKHYSGRVGTTTSPRQWREPVTQPASPDIYDGHLLFHGPGFQVIQEVGGISAGGAVATVAGAREMGWCGRNWHTDPAAVDGGLQLALLWAHQVLGRASLPMGVKECRTHKPGLLDGTTRCVLTARQTWADGAECDIAFVDADGSVRAELIGVELVARPEG